MAFNPVLARTSANELDLVPLTYAPEKLVLKRKGIHLEMKIDGKKYTGKGFLFLTTKRCVFLKEGKLTSHKGWSSADFPLGPMYSNDKPGQPPGFVQPTFGANYLEGCSPPAKNSPHDFGVAATWSFTFKEGGCSQFVKVFYKLQLAAKRSDEAAEAEADRLIDGGAAAFVDPTDPSIIFVQQPVPQQQYQYNPDQGWIASPWDQGTQMAAQPPPPPSAAQPCPPPTYGGVPAPPPAYGAYPSQYGQQAPPGQAYYPPPPQYAGQPPAPYPHPPPQYSQGGGYATPYPGYQQPPPSGGYAQPPPSGGYAQPPPSGVYAQPPPSGGYAQPPPPPASYGYHQPPAGYQYPPYQYAPVPHAPYIAGPQQQPRGVEGPTADRIAEAVNNIEGRGTQQ